MSLAVTHASVMPLVPPKLPFGPTIPFAGSMLAMRPTPPSVKTTRPPSGRSAEARAGPSVTRTSFGELET